MGTVSSRPATRSDDGTMRSGAVVTRGVQGLLSNTISFVACGVFPKHFGVYIGNGVVVDFMQAEEGASEGVIRVVGLSEFAKDLHGQTHEVKVYRDGPEDPEEQKVIVDFAKQLALSGKTFSYDLVIQNCEHVANFIARGGAESQQASKLASPGGVVAAMQSLCRKIAVEQVQRQRFWYFWSREIRATVMRPHIMVNPQIAIPSAIASLVVGLTIGPMFLKLYGSVKKRSVAWKDVEVASSETLVSHDDIEPDPPDFVSAFDEENDAQASHGLFGPTGLFDEVGLSTNEPELPLP